MSVREPVETMQKATTIYYPESDGKPMAETDVHRTLMSELIRELTKRFRDEPDVYVSGNLLVYYVEGNPRKCFAPDVFIVRGVGNHQRRTYKIWEEGRAPKVVIEISSRQTWGDDLQRKWKLYQQLGVQEYFIFDPEYDYLMKLNETLVAYRLVDEEYVPVEVVEGRVTSEALGLELVDTGATLRLYAANAKCFLSTPEEEEAARQAAEARSKAEVEARQGAEAEVARLSEELERLRRLSPTADESAT